MKKIIEERTVDLQLLVRGKKPWFSSREEPATDEGGEKERPI